jgi:threonine/homoserine/homoserine lactone efflux protein
MELRTFLLYLATWTLVALTPGPAVMYSMAAATRFGLRGALAGICGIQAGNFVLFAAVGLGLGALLATADGAFMAIRIAGAAYLIWLGGRVIVGTFKNTQAAESAKQERLDSKSAVQGLLVQITNPKALLFVTALLPQFIDATRPALSQFTILVLTTVCVDAVVLSAYVLIALFGAKSFRRSRFKTWCERAYGAALLFFGGRLLASRRSL